MIIFFFFERIERHSVTLTLCHTDTRHTDTRHTDTRHTDTRHSSMGIALYCLSFELCAQIYNKLEKNC